MKERISPVRMREYLRMYLVMGNVNCRTEPEMVLAEALAGGITLFQFREKGTDALSGEQMFTLARQLQDMCRRASVPFIVNDDVELALELNADGVHIGQDDESAESVRERIGNRILGVSAHTVEEARRAILHGADYLGVGPIYPTVSKDDAKAAQGTAILREMRGAGIELPIVGIGGITADRAEEVIRAGANGVAVISAVTQAERVRSAVEGIAATVNQAVVRLG
ncbi:thiamine-phosphate pyrophosphorylase [Paenibacillus uliginis N3/975]|uniref:Thiamine-phosphate synthase n=1 Tax=Paenibacillus uliginis N3/975 TaxID=1313296 RepID=A0A1X7HQQ2_9BACL|nr:thiamine phosphate synthase [Paenibacillus uliginis]SMF90231.1 thiamine-phosphate pyrophosphorylase [Paenibacillus uliginis N3/975]